MNSSYEQLGALVEHRIQQWIGTLPTTGLYAPMAYIMELPAKRVRPVAMLMASEMFGRDPKNVVDVAVGLELFHNFTLMHDDVMDKAPLRRGQATVHTRWNVNSAILSGDAMLVKAYELIGTAPEVLPMFNHHALGVCEGQQLDMDFEERLDVTTADYMRMIHAKTALLLGCAFGMGAVLGGAGEEERDRMIRFGERIGLAFQLKDDLLDAFGDPQRMGKQLGGDLRAGKKTWLLIRGLELSAERSDPRLREQLERTPEQRDVELMRSILSSMEVPAASRQLIRELEMEAIALLDALPVMEERKEPLRRLAQRLKERVY